MAQSHGGLAEKWTKLKHSVFDVLFVILDKKGEQDQDTVMGLALESGLDYLQMISFSFSGVVLPAWNGGTVLSSISNLITNVLQVNYIFSFVPYDNFLIVLYLANFMIVLVIIDIVYVSYSFSKKKFNFTFPLVLLAQIVPLFVTVLFLPIMEELMSIINCSPSDDPSIFYMQYFPGVQCFVGWHLFHTIISLFFSSVFVFIATVVAMTLFEPRMTSKKLTARKNSKGEVIFIINKFVSQFIFSFTPFTSTWVYTMLLFATSAISFYFYQVHQPYFDPRASKFYRIVSSYYFWTNLALLISQILVSFDFQGGLTIWICGLGLIVLIIYFEDDSKSERLFTGSGKFRSGAELEGHLQEVLLLIHHRKTDKNSNMLLVGYIEKHIESCQEDECPFNANYLKKECDFQEIQEKCAYLLKELERMYIQGIKKFPKCSKLQISFAFFYLEHRNMPNKAYRLFLDAEQNQPSFAEQFNIYRFKKIIRENLQAQDQGLDLIDLIRFDSYITLAEEAMLSSAKLQKQFWNQLQEEAPNLAKMNKLGSLIALTSSQLTLNHEEILKSGNQSPQFFYNYAIYLLMVVQNLTEGKKVLAQSHKKYIQLQHEIVGKQVSLADAVPTIVISAREKTLGTILKISEDFSELSGYLKEEIIQKCLDKILPEVFSVFHQSAMTHWLFDSSKAFMDSPKNEYFHNPHLGFLRKKSNFIVPVTYRLCYNIYEQKFLASVRRIQTIQNQIHIYTTSRGVITDISTLGHAFFERTEPVINCHIEDLDITENEYPKPTPQTKISIENVQFRLTSQAVEMNLEREFLEEGEESNRRHICTLYTLVKVEAGPLEIKSEESSRSYLCRFAQTVQDLYDLTDSHSYANQSPEALAAFSSEDIVAGSPLTDLISSFQCLKEVTARESFNFAQNIKTYRYFRQEMMRVYDDSEDTSEEEEDHAQEFDKLISEREAEKLRSPSYSKKIKEAINTSMAHREVRCLKTAFFLFFLVICWVQIAFLISCLNEFSLLSSNIAGNLSWSEDAAFLGKIVYLATASNRTSHSSLEISNHTFSFGQDISVEARLEGGKKAAMSVRDAMVLIQSELVSYFQPSMMHSNLSLAYLNYYMVTPLIESYKGAYRYGGVQTGQVMVLLGVLACTLLMIGVWVYCTMQINDRCSQILLWFLDIPSNYVNYLAGSCAKFTKVYVQAKDLSQKGIDYNAKHLYVCSYEQETTKASQQFNEENKSRKILIAQHTKKRFFARLDCSYFWFLLLILFTASVIVISLVLVLSAQQFTWILSEKWQSLSADLSYSCKLPSTLYLLADNISIPSVDLNFTSRHAQLSIRNSLEGEEILPITILMAYSPIWAIYKAYYSTDLCLQLNASHPCSSLLNRRLQGGIESYYSYLGALNESEYIEIGQAQYVYVSVSLLNVFESWASDFESIMKGEKTILQVVMYVQLGLNVVGLLLIWLTHLRTLNLRLNQTIQMLNMIPVDFLPRSKRDLKQFFLWIISESTRQRIHIDPH